MTILEALRVTTESIKSWAEGKFLKKTSVDSVLSSVSENPVQNKVINTELESIKASINDFDVSDQISSAIADIKHPVDSVNGKTGAVVLTASDVGAAPYDHTHDDLSNSDLGIYVQDIEPIDAVDGDVWIDTANDPSIIDQNIIVTSVNGMTGDVVIDIPEMVQPDWNQNDSTKPDFVKNRTHWEENNQTVIEWDGSTEGLEQWDFAISGIMLYKVSDATPTLDELYGCLLGAQLGENYVEMELVGQDYNDVVDLNNEINPVNCKFIGRFFVVYDTDINFSGQAFTLTSTGIWATPDFRKLVYGTNTVHPLDEKFIPDTIARKSDIVPGGSSWNDLLDKPSALPNPKSLTLNGAVNASYDGSEEVVVEIPVVEVPVTSVNGMTGDVTIDIPKIPVTSVNGQTGDVQIDIPEPTGSNFVVTLTVTEWTEQINAEGLFASLPACSHTFQEINEAYNADKTIIFDLIESRDEDTHTYLPLMGKTKMNGETTYQFGYNFRNSIIGGYFSRYATRPTVSKKVYMEKITVDSASIGQTVVVKSVDYKGVPTAWEAVDLPSGSSAQADWNQNDPEQMDYIKNRTHWEELIGEKFFSDTAIIPEALAAGLKTPDKLKTNVHKHMVEGATYTVVFNGVSYVCVCQKCETQHTNYVATRWVLGNTDMLRSSVESMYGGLDKVNSDWPFAFEVYTISTASDSEGWWAVWFPGDGPRTATVEVYKGKHDVHQIDEKFIPDTIARVSDISAGLPAVTASDNGKVLMVVDGAWAVVDINLSVDADGVLSV